MQHLIKMKNLYFQKYFPESTKEQISNFFNIPSNENLLCGVWTSPIFRNGFLITDKKLYWYFKTKDGIKKGEIQKDDSISVEFEISPHISENSSTGSANSVSEECSRLEIRAGEQTETFYITGLAEQKAKTLRDILKFGFTQGTLPQIDLGELVKKPPFVPLKNFSDAILNFTDEISEKLGDFKDYFVKGIHEVTHIKFVIKHSDKSEKSSKTENKSEKQKSENVEKNASKAKQNSEEESDFEFIKTESKNEGQKSETTSKSEEKHNSAFSFLLNLFDVCASLLFIASIIVILKPYLIENQGFEAEQFSKISLAGYTLLKCLVAFYSKKGARKIISILLVIISILSYLLLSYSLIMNENSRWLFISVSSVLCLLSYFAFEFSCGFKTESVFKKIQWIIILGILIYVFAHFTIYERKNELINSAKKFGEEIYNFLINCVKKQSE